MDKGNEYYQVARKAKIDGKWDWVWVKEIRLGANIFNSNERLTLNEAQARFAELSTKHPHITFKIIPVE